MVAVDEAAPRREIGEDIFCPSCGYNLHRAPGDRCPECGYALERLRADIPPIPWEHRRHRGRFRTFWQTVWLVTFRLRRFSEVYAGRVAYADARRFQLVTLLHAYLPVLAATIVLYATFEPTAPLTGWARMQRSIMGGGPPQPTLVEKAFAEVWPTIVVHTCFLLFLWAITGVPSYFFHPHSVAVRRQNNAVAMSYYACAPLALIPVLFVPVWGLMKLAALDRWLNEILDVYPSFERVFIVAGALALLAWWMTVVRLERRIMPHLEHRAVALAVSLPLLWAALGAALLVLLPLVVLYVLVIFFSLGS